MKYMNNLFLHIGKVFSEMVKNPSKIIGTVFSLSTLFFMIFLLLMLVSFTLQSVEKAQSKISLTFYLQDDLPDYKAALLKAQLLKMERNMQISSFTYRTKNETLDQFAQNQPDRYQFLQENLGNSVPLSPSFTVHPQSASIETLIQFFLYGDFKESINTEKLAKSTGEIIQNKKILEFLEFLKLGIIGVILLILLGSSIITASFIGMMFTQRKNEVFIMRLVGATAQFIRTPFIIEAIIITLISLFIGWAIFFILRYTALSEMMTVFSSLEEKIIMAQSINSMWNEFLYFLPAIIGIILLFTIISSFITLEKLLQKKDILG